MAEQSGVGPQPGQAVLIRTVTHYYTGWISRIDSRWIELDDAAWIADTGRFADVFSRGPAEVEPYPGRCWIAVGAVVDVAPWPLDLPRKQA